MLKKPCDHLHRSTRLKMMTTDKSKTWEEGWTDQKYKTGSKNLVV